MKLTHINGRGKPLNCPTPFILATLEPRGVPNFSERLTAAIQRTRSPLVVGLDPYLDRLPPTYASLVAGTLWDQAQAVREFSCWVIDAVADLVPAVKPQFAFFEALGPAGMQALFDVIRYAREKNLLVIGDGKRGDIGSTATAYAQAYLGADSPWGLDSLTVNPYLGGDSLEPMVEIARQRQAGLFILVKTSNPGSGDLQELALAEPTGQKLYQQTAALVARLALGGSAGESSAASPITGLGDTGLGDTGLGDIGVVVGATYPAQLSELRQQLPGCWFLIPGYGAQGGSAGDTAGGFLPSGLGAVVNSSRGILYAFDPQDANHAWVDAIRAAAQAATQDLREQTPAGNL